MHIARIFPRFALVLGCLLLMQCGVHVQPKFTEDLDQFFGTYEGNTLSVTKGEISERELAVTIKPWEKKGFTIEWTTVIFLPDGEKRVVSPSINFYSSERPGIFASSMTNDSFGNMVPYDPLKKNADPYVWAGLEENTLTVSALYILEHGSYELHVYSRTLKDEGLELHFERINNGKKMTEILAMLERVNS
ncbi:hypothetical protein ACUNV4_16415 [Granulosicoccus sp. 3-233]|uniref:hypothetical protein n=1 Tax=Granulosicoccus sp. 3-233 TaxID=3417969 RepID=UPI003D33A6E6